MLVGNLSERVVHNRGDEGGGGGREWKVSGINGVPVFSG